jgi:hypothetical protein
VSVAAAARSPGCASWNALGVSGWTAAVTTIPGPFLEGETLRYRIDKSSVGDAFYLMTTGDEILFTTTTTGRKTFVLPKDVAEISFNGSAHPPATWFLSRFSCAAVGAEPPDTAAAASTQSERQDGSALLVILALAAAAMLLASRGPSPTRPKPE